MSVAVEQAGIDYHVVLAQNALQQCLDQPELQSEFICALVKQTSRHTQHRLGVQVKKAARLVSLGTARVVSPAYCLTTLNILYHFFFFFKVISDSDIVIVGRRLSKYGLDLICLIRNHHLTGSGVTSFARTIFLPTRKMVHWVMLSQVLRIFVLRVIFHVKYTTSSMNAKREHRLRILDCDIKEKKTQPRYTLPR